MDLLHQPFLLWCTISLSKTGPMLNHFLRVLSSNQSTKWSIGLMMKGIDPRPIRVTVHFLVMRGIAEVLLNMRLLRKQILLIVYPGMATEAKPCQISVSKTALKIFVWRTESLDHFTYEQMTNPISKLPVTYR